MPTQDEREAWPIRPAAHGAAAATAAIRPRHNPGVGKPASPKAQPVRALAALPPKPVSGSIGFVLFLLVNAVLFIRPAEVFPALEALPIYEVLILGALVTSFKVVLRQMAPRNLLARPQTLFALGILVAIVLSQLVRGRIFYAQLGGTEFLKVVLFFLLLQGLVDTTSRLRLFLLVIAAYIFLIATLALLHHHGIIHLEALTAMTQEEGYLETGERVITIRLQATGIFHDPNDFGLILVVGIMVAMHFFLESGQILLRASCVLVMGAEFFALTLTRSRGGLLALMAGMGIYMLNRVGLKRTLVLAAFAVPALLVAVGGRQTNFNFEDGDTGHGRVAIWRDAMTMFRSSPLFGVGVGEMARQLHIVAHNSFVHCFTELGLLGGPLFLGLFYVPIRMMREMAPPKVPSARNPGVGRGRAVRAPARAALDAPELLHWRTCLLGVMTAYIIGLCSLSRPYTATTYLIVGTAGAFCSIGVARGLIAAPPPYAFLVRRMAVLTVAVILLWYVVVRLIA